LPGTDLVVTQKRPYISKTDVPVAVLLDQSMRVAHAAPCIAQFNDPQTVLDGLQYRLNVVPPCDIPGFHRRALRAQSRLLIHQYPDVFLPLRDEEIQDPREWMIAHEGYTAAFKTQALKVWDEWDGQITKNLFYIKVFGKLESYGVETKHERGIYPRALIARMLMGPVVAAMEKRIYFDPQVGTGIPSFIKHVPVRARPTYLKNFLPNNGQYVETDHSSWERKQTEDVMKYAEYVIYQRLCGSCEKGKQFLDLFRRYIMRPQHMVSKYFDVDVNCCRMSGDMWTSLGNGLNNLLTMRAVCACEGHSLSENSMIVEGDDGIVNFPTSWALSAATMLRYGFEITCVPHSKLSNVKFCGMTYDVENVVCMKDPIPTLVKFGWSTSKWRFSNDKILKELLCGRSRSLAADLGSCPILWKLAEKGLNMTTSVMPRYDVDGFHKAPREGDVVVSEPGIQTRIVFSENYGITVPLQYKYEEEIERCCLNGPLVSALCTTPDAAMMDNNVHHRGPGHPSTWLYIRQ